jgi:RNA polymerase sigma-70 factor, ECF subfamily
MPVAPPEPHPFTATSATPGPSAQHAHPADALVAKAAAGDRAAFEGLYREHVGRVYALCVRMAGDRAAAEELTQDVFVRCWEKLALFRGESAFSTWLHRLAVNVVLHRRKAEGVRRTRFTSSDEGDGEGEAAAATGTSPRQRGGAAGPGDRMDLEAAIAKLPPGARRVFVLHDVEGYKHEEIAGMLGITAGGSKAQLHRARLLLREALQR